MQKMKKQILSYSRLQTSVYILNLVVFKLKMANIVQFFDDPRTFSAKLKVFGV